MRSFEQRLSELLLDVYEAAANPPHWQVFLKNAAAEMDAAKAALHVHYFAPGNITQSAHGGCSAAIGYDATSLDDYADYYAPKDIYVQRIRERFPLGINAGTNDDLLTATELRSTEIYHDYCRINEVFHTCWSAFEQTEGIAAGLGFIRPETSQPFQPRDVELLNLLNPHLAKAFRLQRSLESSAGKNQALLKSIAQFDFGVIALDGEGRIANVSAAAKHLLDRQDGLRVHTGRLQAIQATENDMLQEMLTGTSQAQDNPHRPPASAMLISRAGHRPIQLAVYPFVSSSLLADDQPRVLVFLSDPTAQPASRAAVLRNLYRLTPTESRLADSLLQGLEVREAADRLRTTLETARFHLKRILAKTGTRRQSELMRLMLSLPGAPSDTECSTRRLV
jgi:DNA-binding CsgD family transcriptional regulator/PAS domain-containing protein